MSEQVGFSMTYDWEPFTYHGNHLTFHDHARTRLTQEGSSHWGAVVYKWEGVLDEGEHAGKRGTLIGETDDLRQRVKQYVSGTQKSGNKYWRETFLTRGDIRLFILRLHASHLTATGGTEANYDQAALTSGNFRLILEQLLILRERESKDQCQWIVNRKL